MELERLLRTQGFGSRSECRALVHSGRVRVAGEDCDDPLADFDPEGFSFAVDGVPWTFRKNAYIALNKPANYECSHKPRFHPSVYALLPRPLVTRGVQAVGRLDQDTTGLLLLSDDGAFIHRMNSPKKHVPKVYEVTTRHPLDASQTEKLLRGVVLDDSPKPVAAAAAEAVGTHHLRLTLTEGKYHQVKRMVAAVGNRVEALHRSRIGRLALPADLPEGQWRWLCADDLLALAG